MLTEDSKTRAANLEKTYNLGEPPENLSILNFLDPSSPPLVMKQGTDFALLQVRSVKGGLRLIRMVRTDEKSQWKIDLSEELKSLGRFLEARAALEMIREQSGEYAAFWKAFSNQLGRMRVPQSYRPNGDAKGESVNATDAKKKPGKKRRK